MAALPPLNDALDERERGLIEDALREAGGNVTAAAKLLRTPRTHLYARLQRLGIDHARYRAN